jgi:undecaprenyl-diphosphatase
VGALWYFRHEVKSYVIGAFRSLRRRSIETTDERIAWLLLLSAVPGAIVGALLSSTIDEELGDPILIGVMLIVGAGVLYWADHLPERKEFDEFQTREALLMGAAPAIALQPGVSRAGITISAGRWIGFTRDAAARLSFLMALPIIAGAGLYEGVSVARDGGIPSDFVEPFVWGMVASAISGWIAISFLLRLLRTRSFTPFVIYRLVVGTIVIVVFATGIR